VVNLTTSLPELVKKFYEKYLIRLEADRNGDCLFHSIGHQLRADQEQKFGLTCKTAAYLRKQAVNAVKKHWNRIPRAMRYNVKKSEHVRKMAKRGEWGTHLEMAALSRQWKVPIFVFQENPYILQPYWPDMGDETPGPRVLRDPYDAIYIHYNGVNHFSPLFIKQ